MEDDDEIELLIKPASHQGDSPIRRIQADHADVFDQQSAQSYDAQKLASHERGVPPSQQSASRQD